MTDVDFSFRLDARGRTAEATYEEHVREMIEQVLLTSPGQRINRPDFGSGLLGLVFEPLAVTLTAALQLTLEASLQRWLGDVIEVTAVEVRAEDTRLEVSVGYRIRRTGAQRTDTFEVDT